MFKYTLMPGGEFLFWLHVSTWVVAREICKNLWVLQIPIKDVDMNLSIFNILQKMEPHYYSSVQRKYTSCHIMLKKTRTGSVPCDREVGEGVREADLRARQREGTGMDWNMHMQSYHPHKSSSLNATGTPSHLY